MCIERQFHWCSNPTELMKNIPLLTPYAKKALQPTSEDGAYKLMEDADAQMYTANWNELFNLKKDFAGGKKAEATASTSTSPP